MQISKYSIINSYGYADTARLHDPELEENKIKMHYLYKKVPLNTIN